MQNQAYVALSAQISLERRLSSLAINVANMNTIGYKASGVSFHTVVSDTGDEPVAYATAGDDYISRTQGQIIKTDNPFDIAVSGDGWIAIQTPAGTAYTRDGRMRMQPNGALQTVDGYAVLDAGGAPIQLNPDGDRPVIAKDGMIRQNGREIGAIGLFQIPSGANFQRFDNSALIPDRPATPVLDFDTNGVIQGHLEGSNVNPVLEMAKLMMIQRAFEQVANASQTSESSLKDAVKTLGDVS